MNALCILDEFGYLREDQFLRVTMVDGSVIIIDKTDLVKRKYDALRIFRANGTTILINPECVIMAQILPGERRFHE